MRSFSAMLNFWARLLRSRLTLSSSWRTRFSLRWSDALSFCNWSK